MSNAIIPQEQLTAWQRWELPCFDGHAAPKQGEVALPTAAELEAIQQQARDEGYQAGYAEGLRQAETETQRLSLLLDALGQQVDEQVSQSLLDLALELSRQMLHQALKVNPELVLGVVRNAIASLPHFNQGAHLVMHPEDAALVRQRMGEQLSHSGWKIFEDAQIERGGLRVETANSQIDATVAMRWKHVVSALGQDASWIQE